MPEVAELYAGNYLSAADLKGEKLSGVIIGTGIEKMPPQKGKIQQRVTINLDTARKPMVVGKLNWKKLSSVLGTNTDYWLNAAIEIRPALSSNFGEEQEVLLITSVLKPSQNGQPEPKP